MSPVFALEERRVKMIAVMVLPSVVNVGGGFDVIGMGIAGPVWVFARVSYAQHTILRGFRGHSKDYCKVNLAKSGT